MEGKPEEFFESWGRLKVGDSVTTEEGFIGSGERGTLIAIKKEYNRSGDSGVYGGVSFLQHKGIQWFQIWNIIPYEKKKEGFKPDAFDALKIYLWLTINCFIAGYFLPFLISSKSTDLCILGYIILGGFVYANAVLLWRVFKRVYSRLDT